MEIGAYILIAVVLTSICVYVGKVAVYLRDQSRAKDHPSPRGSSMRIVRIVLFLISGICGIAAGALFLYLPVLDGIPSIGFLIFTVYFGMILSIIGILLIIISYYSAYVVIE